MYRFMGTSIGAAGFGLDVSYVDSYKRTGTANVLPKAPDCGSGKAVQQILNDLGYAAGAVDGVFGKNTFGALARFAVDHGTAYQPSSYPNANLCSLLMQAWQAHQAAAQSVSPPGAGVVAVVAPTPSADVPVPVTQYTASPAGTVGPGGAIVPADGAAPTGIVQKAKDWWAGATSTKKAMVVGGLGLAVVILAAMSLKAPAGKPMTANRRRCRRNATSYGFYVMKYGGGRYTSVAWYATKGEAEREVKRLLGAGLWSGMPPKVEPARAVGGRYARNGGRYLTKAQVMRMFREEVLPAVRAQYGRGDRPAESQAWNDFTDGLQKDGQISARQYDQWTNPMPNRRRMCRNACGCRAPVSVGTMAANGRARVSHRTLRKMTDRQVFGLYTSLRSLLQERPGLHGSRATWTAVWGEMQRRRMAPGGRDYATNASSGRYIHVSWKPSAHAARHSTIVHRSNVAQLKRQLSADGATRVRVVRTGQRPDTHFTRNARTCSKCGGYGYLTIPGDYRVRDRLSGRLGQQFNRWCTCTKGRNMRAAAIDHDDHKMGRGRYARNAGGVHYGIRKHSRDTWGIVLISDHTGDVKDWVRLSTRKAALLPVLRKLQRGGYASNPGPPGHMHRITWKYWTGQSGSTEIPENMLKELVHRLRKVGATDIRVSGDFGRSLMEGAQRNGRSRRRTARSTYAEWVEMLAMRPATRVMLTQLEQDRLRGALTTDQFIVLDMRLRGLLRPTPNRGRSRAKKCSPLKSRVGTCRCTPTAKYRRLGARHASDYAFEQCFMYPIRFHGKGGKIKIELTKKHIRAAAARFAKWKRRYPKTTRGRIGRRIEAAKKRYGIGQR